MKRRRKEWIDEGRKERGVMEEASKGIEKMKKEKTKEGVMARVLRMPRGERSRRRRGPSATNVVVLRIAPAATVGALS